MDRLIRAAEQKRIAIEGSWWNAKVFVVYDMRSFVEMVFMVKFNFSIMAFVVDCWSDYFV